MVYVVTYTEHVEFREYTEVVCVYGDQVQAMKYANDLEVDMNINGNLDEMTPEMIKEYRTSMNLLKDECHHLSLPEFHAKKELIRDANRVYADYDVVTRVHELPILTTYDKQSRGE